MSTKFNPATHKNTPGERAARITTAIREAGDSAPKGVHLVDSREPSPEALAHGPSPEGLAQGVLARLSKAAA